MGQRYKSATISLLAALALAVLLVSGCATPGGRPALQAHVTLYAASASPDDASAWALDGASGKRLWRTPILGATVGPILAGGTL